MDRGRIVDALGLIPDGTFVITGLRLVQWGRELTFACEYNTLQPDGTPDSPVLFHLAFRDCRDFKWKTYAHIALAEVGDVDERSELVEMALGQGGHRRDANLLTPHFAATISYGEAVVIHDGESYSV